MSDTVTISPITEKQVSHWITKLRQATADWKNEKDFSEKLKRKFIMQAYKGILYGALNVLGRWTPSSGWRRTWKTSWREESRSSSTSSDMKHNAYKQKTRKPPFKRGDYLVNTEDWNRDVRTLWKEKKVLFVMSVYLESNNFTAYGMRSGDRRDRWKLTLQRSVDNLEFENDWFPDCPKYVKLTREKMHDVRGTVSGSKFGF